MTWCLSLSAQDGTNDAVAAATPEKRKFGDQQIAQATQLFERFVELENDSDPALADLFSDKAKILNSVRYEDGMTRVFAAPAPLYKEMLRKSLRMPRKTGESNTYAKVEYKLEGSNVRIQASCLSEARRTADPISFLVGLDTSGKWLILEKRVQTRQAGSHELPHQSPLPPSGR
jgi:hypothetical protein